MSESVKRGNLWHSKREKQNAKKDKSRMYRNIMPPLEHERNKIQHRLLNSQVAAKINMAVVLAWWPIRDIAINVVPKYGDTQSPR